MSFVPPNGRCTSAPIVPALTYVMPASRSRIARKAALTSRVKIEDERPYLIPFETRIASSRSPTGMSAVVGPKISSCAIRICGSTSAKTVGR